MNKKRNLLLILLLLSLVFFVNTKKKGKEDSSGILSYLDGKAQKTQAEKELWEFLTQLDPVKGGEKVKTLEKSRAELKLDLGKIIRMAPLTEVDVLRLYKEVTEKGEKTDAKIKITEGQIYSKIDELGEDETLEIETPLASATIRGTVFQVNCESKDKVELDVLKGEVWVYSNEIENPYEYFKKNVGKAKRIGRPFKRIKKPYRRVTKEEWMKIVKDMQRIIITKDGEKTVSDLSKKDLDNKWVEWNKEMDEGKEKDK